MKNLLQVKDLAVHFPIRGGFFNTVQGYVRAVDGVSFSIEEGKTYGLIGESGSGKTTVGKAIVGLEKATGGEILFEGQRMNGASDRRAMKYNKSVQMIFQDVMSSLDPKKRMKDIIAEPIRNFFHLTKSEESARVKELLEIVGMPEESLYKYPYEFSGGQRQRIGVARAIALNPRLIVADEPTSALDISIQAQILNFLKDIQRRFSLSYLFISHDLGVVKHMCDYIFIMYRGRFVESGSREDIYKNPLHIYTKKLIAAIPEMDVERREEYARARRDIEAEYEKKSGEYFDERGRVLELKQISSTHYAAIQD